MKIIFFGSSEFSLNALKACLTSGNTVVKVVTTPPKRQGRGLVEQVNPVHAFALQEAIACIAPPNLKSEEVLAEVQTLQPDLLVVSSYGKMIPNAWLTLPKRYALNIHPSLLPLYRGAAPINWPILNGDIETGLSIAEVTSRLDAGDLFYQKRIPLAEEITSEILMNELGELSVQALGDIFSQLKSGDLLRHPQDESGMTYARKLTKEDGRIDWNKSSREIRNQVRGLLPWPVASLYFEGQAVQILKASCREDDAGASGAGCGEILQITKDQSIKIQTGNGVLSLERVIPPGKKEMSAADFARGRRLLPGYKFQPWPQVSA